MILYIYLCRGSVHFLHVRALAKQKHWFRWVIERVYRILGEKLNILKFIAFWRAGKAVLDRQNMTLLYSRGEQSFLRHWRFSLCVNLNPSLMEGALLFAPSRLPSHISPSSTKIQHHEIMIKVTEANS